MHVRVKVIAGARKETLTKASAGRYIITVREDARQNAANRRVREMLAEKFNVPIGSIRLIKGRKSPGKLFEVTHAHEH